MSIFKLMSAEEIKLVAFQDKRNCSFCGVFIPCDVFSPLAQEIISDFLYCNGDFDVAYTARNIDVILRTMIGLTIIDPTYELIDKLDDAGEKEAASRIRETLSAVNELKINEVKAYRVSDKSGEEFIVHAG